LQKKPACLGRAVAVLIDGVGHDLPPELYRPVVAAIDRTARRGSPNTRWCRARSMLTKAAAAGMLTLRASPGGGPRRRTRGFSGDAHDLVGWPRKAGDLPRRRRSS